MHNLLAQLGKEITRESEREPRQKAQLSIKYEDICEGLTIDTRNVIGIRIGSKYELDITKKAIEGMSNLKFLRVSSDIFHRTIISSQSTLTFISPELRSLEWPNCPMTCLRFKNDIEFLVNLQMAGSNLKKLSYGTKLLRNLKRMNLSYSRNLKELPDLSMATSLKELNLDGCVSLVKLPSSTGNLINLRELNLRGCSLVKLPSSIGNLTNLKELNLSGCSCLVKLPSSIGNLINLRELNLSGCSRRVKLPSSIGNLTNLYKLHLGRCSSLVELPSSIGNLTNLSELILSGCSSLVSLPQLPDSLKCLDAEDCESLEKLDCSFCNLDIHLNLVNCINLNKEARDLIFQTSTLESIVLPGEEVPACFTFKASGSSVTVKLNQNSLRTSTKFKACILVVNKDGTEPHRYGPENNISVSCSMTSKQNALTARRSYDRNLYAILTEHLYIFDFEAEEVTSTELVFTFECRDLMEPSFISEIWEIKECGILSTQELQRWQRNAL